MARPRVPMFPLGPLMACSGMDQSTSLVHHDYGSRYGPTRVDQLQPGPVAALAELAGVNRRQVHRWAHDGIPLTRAEDLCDLLGLHPCGVWGDVWLAAVLGHPEAQEMSQRAV